LNFRVSLPPGTFQSKEKPMGLEVGGLLGIIWLIIVIWAVIKCAQSPAGPLAKAIWMVVILVFPVIGLLIWLLFGPKG